MGLLAIQRYLLAIFLAAGLSPLAHADQMPPTSGVVAIATEPASVKTVSLEGNIIGRTAGVGQPIYINDEIKTGAQNRLQILLKDQSVFNIGPNSSLTIDKFVYDPTRPELSVNIQRGTFKFVSGRISNGNPDAMKVKLPNATIAVRGTGVAGEVAANGSSTVVLLHGTVDVSSTAAGASSTATLSKSGWGVQVGTAGNVSAPTLLPAEAVNGILQKVGKVSATNTVQVPAPQLNASASTSNTSDLATSTAPSQNFSSNTAAISLATGNALQTAVTPYAFSSATSSSNARGIAYGLSTLPNAYLSLIPADYLSYLIYAGTVNNTLPSDTSQSLSGTTTTPNAVDQYMAATYPTQYGAGMFDVTQQLAAISANFDAAVSALPTSNPNFAGYSIVKVNDLKNYVQNPAIGPLGIYEFSATQPGVSSAFGLNCASGGNSCGYNAGGNLFSQIVRLNYNAAQISNTYTLSYTYGGVGTSIAQQTVTLAGSGSSTFAGLAGSTSGNAIKLPVDPTHTQLNMLGTFFKNAADMQAILKTSIVQPIGNTTSITLQTIDISATGRCVSGVGTCR